MMMISAKPNSSSSSFFLRGVGYEKGLWRKLGPRFENRPLAATPGGHSVSSAQLSSKKLTRKTLWENTLPSVSNRVGVRGCIVDFSESACGAARRTSSICTSPRSVRIRSTVVVERGKASLAILPVSWSLGEISG